MLEQWKRLAVVACVSGFIIVIGNLVFTHNTWSSVRKEASLTPVQHEQVPDLAVSSGRSLKIFSKWPPNSNATFVHQSWKNSKLPPRFMRWYATWDVCFPAYSHLLWTDADNLQLVKEAEPQFEQQYLSYTDKIQRADAVRYLYMYYYGGIYSDLDNECLRSFKHLIEQSQCGVILSSMRSNRKANYIQNSFMYSRPKHPLWRRVLQAMRLRRNMKGAYPQDTVDLTTGPKLLMHVVEQSKHLFANSADPGRICVFPDNYFNPYSWDLDKNGPCKDLNQMTEHDLALCKIRHKTAYVLQYHTQSWLDGKVK